MTNGVNDLYEFENFRLDGRNATLTRGGDAVSLSPKAFELLKFLVERRGTVVSKQEIFDNVWADTFVEDGVLTQNVYTLRNVLGTDEKGGQFIETVPRRGYRFADARTEAEEREDAVRDTPSEPVAPSRPATERPKRLLKLALLLIASVAAAGILGSLSWMNRSGDEIRSIAVLPFTHVEGGEPDASFEFGLTDTLITRLSKIRRIVVRPAGAISKYEGRGDTVNIGRELNVDAVLEGRIQRQGEKLRINVQVIRTSDGTSIWAEQFDSEMTDMFAVQDSISTSVAEAIVSKLDGTERELVSKRPTQNAEAYRLYATGRYFWNKRIEESRRKAIELFNQAIDLDPSFALAYVGLADCYVLGGYGSGMPIGETMGRARQAASRALELDPTLAEAHASLALISLTYDWDFATAERGFKRAIELNPNFAGAHQWYSDHLIAKGRFDEALNELAKAKALDPTSLAIQRDLGRAYYFSRDADRAIEHLHRTLEMDENFFPAVLTLSNAYLLKGDYAAATTEIERAIRLSNGTALSRAYLVFAYSKAGRSDEAARVFNELENASPQAKRPYDMAIANIGLGNHDAAIDLLEKACKERSYRLIYLNSDPIFDDLRRIDHFQKLPCFELLK